MFLPFDEKSLRSDAGSRAFYEQRYRQGYMEYRSPEQLRRILEVIGSIPLPEKGRCLDFGCGRGLFTEALRQALPGWEIDGYDISPHAIDMASQSYLRCSFSADTVKENLHSYDLVFSHHVLEHVYDLALAMEEVDLFAKPERSWMIHILPCGNPGSFEHFLCDSVLADGIEKEKESRFCFEDQGHLRRLTTEQMVDLMKKHRFALFDAFYSSHLWGAFEWISRSHPKTIYAMSNPLKGRTIGWSFVLFFLLILMLALLCIRAPYLLYGRLLGKRILRGRILAALLFLPSLLARPFYWIVVELARREWEKKKKKPNGSEMFLVFSR